MSRLCGLAIVLCLGLPAAQAQYLAQTIPNEDASPCLAVDSLFRQTPLSTCLRLFTDTTNQLLLNDVRQQAFTPLTTPQPNFGRDSFTHWCLFSCVNEDTKARHLIVELDNIFFDEVSFYVVSQGKRIQAYEHINWHLAPANRPVPSRYYAFPLTLQAHQAVAIYIRIQFRGGIFVCPITLADQAYHQQQYWLNTFIYLIPCVILALIAFISLLLWVGYQKPVLLYYLMYTVGCLGFILNIEGFLVSYAQWPFTGPKGWILCLCVVWIGNLLFTQHYVFRPHRLPYETVRQRSFQVVIALIGLLLALALTIPPNGSLALAGLVMNALCPLFAVGWLVVGLRYRLLEARIYAVAILPLMVCGCLVAIGGESFLPIGDKLFVLLFYAPPIEIIVLGFGISRQFLQEREALLKTVQLVQQDIIQTQETERQRLAADLHDDLGGTLATIRQRLSDIRLHLHDPQAAHDLDALEPLIQKSGHDLRRIAHNLMPPDFERLGLCTALEQFIQSQPAQYTRFSFIVAGQVRSLPVDVELNLYRIVSELVQNIHKHARAGQAAVQLLYQDTHLSITVEDDGLGNQVAAISKEENGIGLKNSRLRAEYIGATLHREVGQSGTFVLIEMSYKPNA